MNSKIHKCPHTGSLYRWKYDERLGVYVSDFIAKNKPMNDTNDSPCSRTKPLRDKGLTALLGGPL